MTSFDELRRVAAKFGCVVERRGAAIKITGPGVDLLVASPANVSILDLSPPERRPAWRPRERREPVA